MQKYKVGDVVTVIESKDRVHNLKHNTIAAILEVYDYDEFGCTYLVLGQDFDKHETICQFIKDCDIKG